LFISDQNPKCFCIKIRYNISLVFIFAQHTHLFVYSYA
jgi:hypothetical protein